MDFIEDYTRKSNEIMSILLICYKDIFLLEVLNNLNQSINNNQVNYIGATIDSLNHICFLLKNDLVLNIFKITYDDDAKANTISNLNSELHKYCKKHNLSDKLNQTKRDPKIKEMESSVKSARNHFIAHLDKNKNDLTISVKDLSILLEKIRNEYNKTCVYFLDGHIMQLSDEIINTQKFKYMAGFELLLNIGTIKIDT